jgi:hypothetical protein
MASVTGIPIACAIPRSGGRPAPRSTKTPRVDPSTLRNQPANATLLHGALTRQLEANYSVSKRAGRGSATASRAVGSRALPRSQAFTSRTFCRSPQPARGPGARAAQQRMPCCAPGSPKNSRLCQVLVVPAIVMV